MKGYFSLNVVDEWITFGNLVGDEPEAHAIGNIYWTNNAQGRLIAHDVIEHTVTHRTNRYVTIEEELRALGAVMFVRMGEVFDISVDVLGNLRHLYRELKNPPISTDIVYVDEDIFLNDDLDHIPEEDYQSIIQTVNNNIEFGYQRKYQQFNGDQYKANKAFDFIRREADHLMNIVEWDNPYLKGVSVYFDTDMKIFRFRHKWHH